ncbi:uncharacterized protein LOC111628657 [Centruroides sculpturatus]|uniref:uncharacterized protein LOC111628657 n=1 Tax=Centruroides sculpturatus TaxID=218467 RepID=UPI000C6CDE2F|nr:uncharacterized protein LOC111628657 [Centruroides sculpturatus]
MKSISRNKWGYGPAASRTLYTAAIEPIISYGAEIWGSAATRVHIRRKLLSLQRLFSINIAKAYKTAPTDALQIINRTLPIDLKIREMYIRHHLTKLAENQYTMDHFNSIADKEDYPEDLKKIANLIKDNDIDKSRAYLHVHPSFAPEVNINTGTCVHHNINIYTDGSKTTDYVGCAFVVFTKGRCVFQLCRTLAQHCTNNQAESCQPHPVS